MCQPCRATVKYLKRTATYLSLISKRGCKCELCGKGLDRPHIHHKDNKGYGQTSKPNNAFVNLMVVCPQCHIGVLHKSEKEKRTLTERNQYIIQKHNEGWGTRAIGKAVNLSHARVCIILKQEQEKCDTTTVKQDK